jgi:hypothetical protein
MVRAFMRITLHHRTARAGARAMEMARGSRDYAVHG